MQLQYFFPAKIQKYPNIKIFYHKYKKQNIHFFYFSYIKLYTRMCNRRKEKKNCILSVKQNTNYIVIYLQKITSI